MNPFHLTEGIFMRSNAWNYEYGFSMFTEKCIVLLYSSVIDDFYKAMYFVDITSRVTYG